MIVFVLACGPGLTVLVPPESLPRLHFPFLSTSFRPPFSFFFFLLLLLPRGEEVDPAGRLMEWRGRSCNLMQLMERQPSVGRRRAGFICITQVRVVPPESMYKKKKKKNKGVLVLPAAFALFLVWMERWIIT
jgi:hypothetical protein